MNHRRDFFLLLAYIALALVATFPLALNFATHVAGTETDAPTLAWNLWWVKYAFFNLRVSPLATDYLFYPVGVNLAAHTLTLVNGLLALPIQFAANVIAANNALVIFSLVIGAYGMNLLARDRLRRAGLDPRAAIFAGALYGIGNAHVNYVALGRPDLAGSQWFPFYFLFLLRALESPRRAWKAGALAGLFLALTAWTELTYAAFLIALTIVYALWQWFATRRARTWARQFAALSTVSLLALAPMLAALAGEALRFGDFVSVATPRAQILSADLLGFFIPAASNPILSRLAQIFSVPTTNYTFAGFIPLALAVWACARYRAARVGGVIALGFAVLMLGPALQIAGNATPAPMPFQIIQQIPILKWTRFPIRLNEFFLFGIALAASFALADLLRRARENSAWRNGVAALVLFGALEQIALPLPLTDLRPAPVYTQFANDPGDFTILELPLGWRNSAATQGKLDVAAQFFQSVHQKRLITGTVARAPQFKLQYYNELPVLNSLLALEAGQEIDAVRLALDKEAALEILRFFNIHHVILNRAQADPRVAAYALQVFPLQEVYRDDEQILYRVTTALPAQGTVQARDDTARLNFDDGWGRAQISPDNLDYRWSTSNEARVWLPLTRNDYRISFLALTPNPDQRIGVRINGHALDPIIGQDTWNAFTLHVPSIFLRNGLNEIIFSTDLTPTDAVRLDDYAIGATGVAAPVDVAATGAGFNAGRFGEIFVGGRSVIPNTRGYHLVAIHPKTGAVDRVGAFDTFASADESRALIEFVNALPRGEIVAGVAVDDVSKNLQAEAVDALRQLGVDSDLRFAFRDGHAFIGVKGAAPGQALEFVDGRFPANVSVGKNVRGNSVSFALGPLHFEQVR